MSGAAYDVVVLGGGPAGTATALALRRHEPALSVAVVEASTYEGARIGETLPPQARTLLEHLGAWHAFNADGHATARGTTAVWGDERPHVNEFLFRTHGEGWHLDRARFDRTLARQVEEQGSTLYLGTAFIGCESTPAAGGRNGWRLQLGRDRRRLVLDARFVVDATGRRAAFARRSGAGRIGFDRLVGVYAFFTLRRGEVFPTTHTLVEAWREGWWYSARLPGDRAVVACMSDADRVAGLGLRRPERWLAQLARTRHTRDVLGAGEPEAGPRCHPAHSQLLEPLTGAGWLAVGDAACTFDPLSSLGILKALRFGVYAAYAAADDLRGEDAATAKYRSLVRADFEGYLETRMEYYRQERRWADSSFWRRRFGCVTLDPRQVLSAGPSGAGRSLRIRPMHLPVAELERLCALCRSPRAASDVVADFQRQQPSFLSDRRVILALQHLVAEEALIRQPTTAAGDRADQPAPAP